MLRIIIIVGQASAGLGAVLLPLGAVFLFAISQEGDGVPNTINYVDRATFLYCYPSANVYWKAGPILKPGSESEVKILEEYGITKIYKGEEVKIHKEIIDRFYIRVTPINEPRRSCFVHFGFLEMGMYEWIKWKLSQV